VIIPALQATKLPLSDLAGRSRGLYRYQAGIAYALILLLPLIFTLDFHTFRVNRNAGLLLILGAFILAPKFDRSLLSPPASHKIGAILVFLGVFFVAWQWQHGDVWLNSQFLLYCGIAAMFPLAVQWFRRTGTAGLRYVFLLKLAGVVGATALFILAIADLTGPEPSIGMLVREPPIYRDTRHFNYDHLVVLSLAVYFASLSKSRAEGIGWLAVCVAIGYVLAWSGGRAAIGSILVFLFVAGWSKAIPCRMAIAWTIALLISCALVVMSGRSDLLLGQFSRLGDGAEVMASGRLELWAGILGVWSRSWASMLFGLGPDAVRMVVRAEIGFPPNVQAHSVIVQALIEFGLIGLGLVSAAIFVVARRAVAVLRSSIAPRDVRVAAALLVALGAYMFVDGILYHAIPLIMVMLLTAYLFHYQSDLADTGAASVAKFRTRTWSTDSGR
jgi:O-antigen ligase